MLQKLSLGMTTLSAISTRPRDDLYDPAAAVLFARMDTQPDNPRKALISNLISALKAAGVWANLDFLYVLAAHSAQAARLNWVASDELTAYSAPLFTIDRGFKGDGVGAYLELPFNQATLAKAGQNNASWLLGVRAEGTNGRFVIGANSAVRFAFNPASSSINLRNTQGAINDSLEGPRTGRFGSTRSAATTHSVYRNGSPVLTTATASVSPGSSPIYLLRGSSVYSDAELTHYAAGAGLSAQQHLDADAALAIYLTALGAF